MLKLPSSHTCINAEKGVKALHKQSIKPNAYSPEPKSDVSLHLARGSVKRMVNVVSHVGSKEPVVAAVPEQVTQRHGGVREAMDEQRLQDAFGVMGNPAYSSNT